MRSRRFFLVFVAASCLVPLASAQDAAAEGDWIGQVSWSDPRILYSWLINADGTFSSGRQGRGHDGGGVWSAHNGRLTLKYPDGFRYEGALAEGVYSGSAYAANGRRLGGFSMSRSLKDAAD